MSKILIAGCGDIGSAVAQGLLEDGHSVTGLKRQPPSHTKLGIDYFQADLTHSASLAQLPIESFDQVIYCLSPAGSDEAAYRAVFDLGLDNLLRLISATNSKCSVTFVSSTRVYGQNQGEWVDESSATTPQDFRGQILLTAEQKVLASNTNNTIVRLSGIYGGGRNYLVSLAQRSAEIQQSPSYFTNRIHRQDCIGVLHFIVNLKAHNRALESIYIATDDKPAPLWEVISWLANTHQFDPPIAQQLADDAKRGKRCCNQRIKSLGYQFQYHSYLEGYAL